MRFFIPLRSFNRLARVVFGLLVALTVALAAQPGSADLTEDLEKLREEQSKVQEQKKEVADDIDVATAEADELAAALEVVNAEVNEQATKVAAAERALIAAQDRHDAAVLAVVQLQGEIDDLEGRVSDQAISSFVSGNDLRSPILEEVDPNLAVRMQSLAQVISEDGISAADDLRRAKEDLEIEQKIASDATDEAESIQLRMAEDLAELERRKDEQSALWEAAEERLERNLAEAAALSELDEELSAEIVEKNEELAKQARAQSNTQIARNNPAPANNVSGFPSAGDIVNVKGFWVHRDIASSFEAMLNHAESDGITFGGGAYRDHASQIRLRKAHCGTSNYAVYHMPASQCRPPTARPGASMHEQGKAIDFRYNGSIIGSRNNSGYRWLAANAATYGFYNLPSEPWHWSTNGR
ncbi:MAG: D-alanyl-D-alanine carboxypeptidase family protein [Actinomycetota bacterium]